MQKCIALSMPAARYPNNSTQRPLIWLPANGIESFVGYFPTAYTMPSTEKALAIACVMRYPLYTT